MKLLQGKTQYEEQGNWGDDYPELHTDLMTGVTTSGVVCFPVVDISEDIVLHIDGSSDDWEEELDQYVFKISNP